MTVDHCIQLQTTHRFGLVDGNLLNLGLEMWTPRWIHDGQTRKSDGWRRQDKVNAWRWYLTVHAAAITD